eukprot:745401-Ditylum_brightwellii.AAC.1
MFDVSWDFWHHRNHYLKLAEADNQINLISKLQSQIVHHYLLGSDNLPIRCQFLYYQTLSSILSSMLRHRLSWLQTVVHSRLCFHLLHPNFSTNDDEDLILLDKIIKNRLRNRQKQSRKEPRLCTQVEGQTKQLFTVPHDPSDDSFEEPTVVLISYSNPN